MVRKQAKARPNDFGVYTGLSRAHVEPRSIELKSREGFCACEDCKAKFGPRLDKCHFPVAISDLKGRACFVFVCLWVPLNSNLLAKHETTP